jgi:hypothetical protein
MKGSATALGRFSSNELGQLDKGDVLMVTRLDRLARSSRDLLNTIETPFVESQKEAKSTKARIRSFVLFVNFLAS